MSKRALTAVAAGAALTVVAIRRRIGEYVRHAPTDPAVYPGPPGSGVDIVNAHGLNWPKAAPRIGIIMVTSDDPWVNLENFFVTHDPERLAEYVREQDYPSYIIGDLTVPSPEEQREGGRKGDESGGPSSDQTGDPPRPAF